VLLYGLEVCPLNIPDLRLLDFFVKLFIHSFIDVTLKFHQITSILIEKRRETFWRVSIYMAIIHDDVITEKSCVYVQT